MTEQIDVDAILRANPNIDPGEFERIREALRRLAPPDTGSKRHVPLPPFGGRRVSVRDTVPEDPRTVRLRRSV